MQENNLKKVILEKVVEKKELKSLSKEYLDEELNNFILENKKLWEKVKDKYATNADKIQKSKEFKTIIKSIRTRLRAIFGVFYLKGFENTEKLINSITPNNKEIITFEILKLHRSSKERLRDYEEIYDKIYEITKIRPKIILDLACGYNPFSYYFIRESFQYDPDYICCDIGKKDIYLINKFFQNAEINGKAIYCDLRNNINVMKKFNADICFMFKTLDSLDTNSNNASNILTKKILKEIKTKYFIVSFASKSIGGNKTINKKKRTWFYKLLQELSFSYEEFSIHNELFIVVKKS